MLYVYRGYFINCIESIQQYLIKTEPCILEGSGTSRTNQGMNNTPMLTQAFAQNQCNPSNNQAASTVPRPNISGTILNCF